MLPTLHTRTEGRHSIGGTISLCAVAGAEVVRVLRNGRYHYYPTRSLTCEQSFRVIRILLRGKFMHAYRFFSLTKVVNLCFLDPLKQRMRSAAEHCLFETCHIESTLPAC